MPAASAAVRKEDQSIRAFWHGQISFKNEITYLYLHKFFMHVTYHNFSPACQ
jgi:hypothetical protein